jgi:hypothetical protein
LAKGSAPKRKQAKYFQNKKAVSGSAGPGTLPGLWVQWTARWEVQPALITQLFNNKYNSEE